MHSKGVVEYISSFSITLLLLLTLLFPIFSKHERALADSVAGDGWFLVESGLDFNKYLNLTTGEYRIMVSSSIINYQADNGTFMPIDTDFYVLPQNHPARQFGYVAGNEHGVFEVYFKRNAQADYPVVFNYNRNNDNYSHALRSEIHGFGYYAPSNNHDWVVLQQAQSVNGTINGSTGTWEGILSGVNATWTYENTQLKEELFFSNTTKTLLQNNPPSNYGMNNAEAYCVIVTRLDYHHMNLTDENNVTVDTNFTFNGTFFLRNHLGEILAMFPQGFVYEVDNTSSYKNMITRHVVHNGEHYLMSGIKASRLNSMTFPVCFDPTFSYWTPSVNYDGWMYNTHLMWGDINTQENWDNIVNATSANQSGSSSQTYNYGVRARHWMQPSGIYHMLSCDRSIFSFDTGNLTDATITDASLFIYDGSSGTYTNATHVVYNCSNTSTIDTSDWDAFDSTLGNISQKRTSWTNGVYNEIPLNENDSYVWVMQDGLTFLMIREHDHDAMMTMPQNRTQVGIGVSYSNHDGYEPYLNLTFTQPDYEPLYSDPYPYDEMHWADPEGGVHCFINVWDLAGESLNVTWATNNTGSVWQVKHTNHSVVNATGEKALVSYVFEDFDNYNNASFYRVYVDDGTTNVTSSIYGFNTMRHTKYHWRSPDTGETVQNGWTNEENAIDESLATSAYCSDKENGKAIFFNLTTPIEYCDGIRIYSEELERVYEDAFFNVSLYYNDQWNGIFNGTVTARQYVNVTNPVGNATVYGVRLIPYNINSKYMSHIYEIDFINHTTTGKWRMQDNLNGSYYNSTPVNQPPTETSPTPSNNTLHILSCSGVNCSITVADPEGQNMNITFATNHTGSVWTPVYTYHGMANGTYGYNFADVNNNFTWNFWQVYVNDGNGENTTGNIYGFKSQWDDYQELHDPDSATGWVNADNAKDNDTGTHAYTSDQVSYLYVNLSNNITSCSNIQINTSTFWASIGDHDCTIWVENGEDSWTQVHSGSLAHSTWHNISVDNISTHSVRIVSNEASGIKQGRVYELNFFNWSSCDVANEPPTANITFAGNPNDIGSPYYIPSEENTSLLAGGFAQQGYYTNNSRQIEDFIEINVTASDSDGTVSTVRLCLWNITDDYWDNSSTLSNTGADFWWINKTGLTSNKEYTFRINATDNDGDSTIEYWQKRGNMSVMINRSYFAGCTPENSLNNTVFYLHDENGINTSGIESTYNPYDIDIFDRAGLDFTYLDNVDESRDQGLLEPFRQPTDAMHESWCSLWTGHWANLSNCTEDFVLYNVYYHVWVASNTSTGEYNLSVAMSNGKNTYVDTISDGNRVQKDDDTDVSNITFDSSYHKPKDNYSLGAGVLVLGTTIDFSDNNLNEFLWIMQEYPNEGGDSYPQTISNASIKSFIIWNIADNTTLQGWDNDTDGLNNYQELFETFTDPYDADTDNDGVNDYYEEMSGSDPNNFTDTHNITWNTENDLNGTYYNQTSWDTIDDLNGSYYNVTDWESIDDINGSYYNSTSWISQNDINGSYYNITGWESQNDINGSYYNSTSWESIDDLNGSYYNATDWSTIDDLNGSYYNQSSFQTVDDLNGSYFNLTSWDTIDDLNGSYFNQSSWNTENDLNGSYYNITGWESQNDLNGSYYNVTDWESIDDLNGSYYNSTDWSSIDNLNGSYYNITGWTSENDLNGSYYNQTSWDSIDNLNGSYYNSTGWNTENDLNGTYYNSTDWETQNDINGSYYNSTSWDNIDNINGSYYNSTDWSSIDDINGSYYNTTSWEAIDTLNGSYWNGTDFQTIDDLNGSYYNVTDWESIDDLNGSYYNSTDWNNIDDLNGSYYNSTSWSVENNLNGSYWNGTDFQSVDDLNGSYYNVTDWDSQNDINGSYYNSTDWNNIDDINGSYYNSTSWSTENDINGSYWNGTDFQTIDDLNGSYYNITSWENIDDLNGSYYNSTDWSSIDDINGSYYNSTSWISQNDLNGTYWNGTDWNSENDINGSYYNSTSWETIDDLNGSYYNVTDWESIDDLNGSYYNSTSFQTEDDISGSYWNGTGFQGVDTLNGSYYNVTSWETQNTLNGSYFNSTSWSNIDDLNGTYYNSTDFNMIDDLNGTYWNGTSFTGIDDLNGSYYNSTDWSNIDDLNGSYYNQTLWVSQNNLNGSYYNVTPWNTENDLNGSYWNGTSFSTIDDINGSYYNSTDWATIDNLNGSYYNSTDWNNIDDINGTYYNASAWNTENDINGSYYNQSSYQTIDDLNGSYYNSTDWETIDDISGDYYNTSIWNTENDLNGSYWNGTSWTSQNDLNGSYYNVTPYYTIDDLNGSYYNITDWNNIDDINGSYYNTSDFQTIDDLNGSYYNSSNWNTENNLNGTYWNVTIWVTQNDLNGSYYNATVFITINDLNGSYYNSTPFSTEDDLNGSYWNSTGWENIDDLNGSYFNLSTYFIIDTINGTYYNISFYITMDNINGTYWNSTTLIFLTDEYPDNNTYLNSIQPTLFFTLTSQVGRDMNYTIYVGTDINSTDTILDTGENVTNGTFHYNNYYQASNYTQHWWRVLVNDGHQEINESFCFTNTQGIGSVTGGGRSSSVLAIAGVAIIIPLIALVFLFGRRKRKKQNYNPYRKRGLY